MNIKFLAVTAGLFVATGMTGAAYAENSPSDLTKMLQKGGLVVYLRHTATEADYADQVSADPLDCSTQRMLSEKGWQDARQIGAAFKALDLPVGDVISSQFCRAWQTADLAFGTYTKDPALNFEKAEDYTTEQIAAMRDRVTPLLTAPVLNGNRIIVGHDDPFEAATGIYPEPQGVAFIIQPGPNQTFTILGSIPPNAWQ